ncbi:hypothetical protein AB0K23_39715 [Streptomyces sp. NPDC049602]|uniref:hypothetical protein n=1 Tax=Streptomyces sp. NPDC049602 TaxID=3155504 RepID=UPI00342F2E92
MRDLGGARAQVARGAVEDAPRPHPGRRSIRRHYYFNRSHLDHSGSLRRATVTDGRPTDCGNDVTNAVGPEDLYVEHGQSVPDGVQYLWSLTEHRTDDTAGRTDAGSPCGRVIYAHRLSDVLARP